jgi:hypothetical protein
MDMKGEYLNTVDKVIMKAFDEGVIVIEKELWEDYAIRHRLLLYGEIKDGYYSLNEFGIRYVMEGCSNGLKDKIKRQEEIERLEIETQSFTKKKQKYTFWMATIGGGIAIVQAIVSIVKLMISVDI